MLMATTLTTSYNGHIPFKQTTRRHWH